MMPVPRPAEDPASPTAQALRAEVAVTPASRPSAGLGTSAEGCPFQCSVAVGFFCCGGRVPRTARALVPEGAVTPARPPGPPRAGLCTRAHAVPFQCSIRAAVPCAVMLLPTAQALVAEVAATLLRIPPNLRAGLGTCCHAVPFQCSISGTRRGVVVVSPTAQALVAEVAATPLSSEKAPGGVGLFTRVQALPFQRRITVLPAELAPPTAQTSPRETAATACRIAGPPVLAAAIGAHAVPFQCSIRASLLGPYPTAQASAAERTATP